MADINSVIVKINAALDEAYLAAGLPNPSAQLATVTQEKDAALVLAATRRSALDAVIAQIVAANNADAAEQAADSAGDAARAQALTLANAAP